MVIWFWLINNFLFMFNESCPVLSPPAATYTATNAATLAMDDAVSKMTVPAVYNRARCPHLMILSSKLPSAYTGAKGGSWAGFRNNLFENLPQRLPEPITRSKSQHAQKVTTKAAHMMDTSRDGTKVNNKTFPSQLVGKSSSWESVCGGDRTIFVHLVYPSRKSVLGMPGTNRQALTLASLYCTMITVCVCVCVLNPI